MSRAKTVNGIEYDIVIRPLNLCIEYAYEHMLKKFTFNTTYQYDHDKKTDSVYAGTRIAVGWR